LKQAPSPFINPYQPSSTLINPYQPSSTPINPYQPSSTLINPNKPSSTLINPNKPSSTLTMIIQAQNLTKRFGAFTAVAAISGFSGPTALEKAPPCVC
jgi:hypothetical protein